QTSVPVTRLETRASGSAAAALVTATSPRGVGASATSGMIRRATAAAKKYDAGRGRAGSYGIIWRREHNRGGAEARSSRDRRIFVRPRAESARAAQGPHSARWRASSFASFGERSLSRLARRRDRAWRLCL